MIRILFLLVAIPFLGEEAVGFRLKVPRKASFVKLPTALLVSASPDPITDPTPINGESNRQSGYDTDKMYSQFLRRTGRARRAAVVDEDDRDEDGYAGLMDKRRSWIRRAAKFPFSTVNKLMNPPKEPGTLILVRHGESTWNANKTFTGWADPDLSEQGKREVEHAARLLLEGGYEIDVVFTSRLKRAIRSVWIVLSEMNETYLPVFKSWRLNERMYGALTGLSKTETAEKLGANLVQKWRGSLRSRPPPVRKVDANWPGRDRKFFDLSDAQIPRTESLEDCMKRTGPVWTSKIRKELSKGRNVMVVAHGNTLRGLVKKIDNIGDEEIKEVVIPTGIPIIYKFDKYLKPVKAEGDGKITARQMHMNGLFLEKAGLLRDALKREEKWSENVPGYNSTMARVSRPMSQLERSLFKLQAERKLGEWASNYIEDTPLDEDDGNDGNQGKPVQWLEDKVWEEGLKMMQKGESTIRVNGDSKATLEEDDDDDGDDDDVSPTLIRANPCVTSMPSAVAIPGMGNVEVRKDAVLVIIRHGKTEHNKLKLFTGWEDAPLAAEGIDEALKAGELLKLHGFEFDVVYTSWLSRAIETAWYVMDAMDCLWLPIIKSWRLNERMYGALTGLSKRMVAQRHGEAQFKAWRRGYKTRPPPVSSFSRHYPGNDKRYMKYLSDVRYSLRESVIRSIEAGRPVVRRKLPKHESLKDCMDRTIPYFVERIVPEALGQGKRVLISSSENAIRGLLMHLCNIPEEQITGLEIPNGLPLIYDLNSKCIKLLDDGTGRDPLAVYDFGKAAKYLFRPCQNDDGSPDEECDVTYMSEYYAKTFQNIGVTKEQQEALDQIRGAKVPVKN